MSTPRPPCLPERDRGRGRHHRVHRRGQDGELEAVGVDLPGDADLLGVAGAPRGHDRDVVEGVGTARRAWPGRSRSRSRGQLIDPTGRSRRRVRAVTDVLARRSTAATVELCDECGFDARERPRRWTTRRRAGRGYADLERLLGPPGRPSDGRRGRPGRTGSTSTTASRSLGPCWSGRPATAGRTAPGALPTCRGAATVRRRGPAFTTAERAAVLAGEVPEADDGRVARPAPAPRRRAPRVARRALAARPTLASAATPEISSAGSRLSDRSSWAPRRSSARRAGGSP